MKTTLNSKIHTCVKEYEIINLPMPSLSFSSVSLANLKRLGLFLSKVSTKS